MRRFLRSSILGAVLIAMASAPAAVAAPITAARAAPVATPRQVAVSGQVLDARVLSTPRGASVVIPNGLHKIARARVSVRFPSGTTVNTVTGRTGQFTVPRPAGTPAKATVTVTVHARGFGAWRETGVPAALPHGDYPVLTVLLRTTAQAVAYPRNPTITGRPGPASGSGLTARARTDSGARRLAHAPSAAGGCTGYFSNVVPPATIRVYNINAGAIETYNFEYYVENVLPNEWLSGWDAASLDAGAMAVKTYGWYWVNNWAGGSLDGTCYDVSGGTYSDGSCDTDYQCFIPGTAVAGGATDMAVEYTWTDVAQRSGAVFEATYNSGYTTDQCGQEDGSAATGSEMSQYGTQACASDYGWRSIFRIYYFPDVLITCGEPCGGLLADINGDGLPDIIAVNPSGNLYLYPNTGGTGVNTFGSPIQVGSAWQQTTLVAVGDPYGTEGPNGPVNGLLGINDVGQLYYYSNNGNDTFSAPIQVGTGWGGYTIAGLTDLYNTGAQGIVAIDPSGNLWYYPNAGGTGLDTFGARVQIGSGWTGWTVDVADINGDGRPDLLAVSPSGNLYVYPNTGKTGLNTFGARIQVGSGWTGYQAMDAAYLGPNAGADIVAIDPNGYLYLYPNTGSDEFGARELIGSGWTGYQIN
jgi:hypothetical protein